MSLGFSVEALVPAGRGAGALRMGLVRLAEAEWLWPEFDRAARADVFARHPESVVVQAEAEEAAREAAQAVAGCDTLGEAAASVWEDLCVLQDVAGQTRLTAAALGFPTDWHLGEKMGTELTAIHAPIHGYAEQLAEGVGNFLTRLEPGPIWGRANWFVVANDEPRYLPTCDAAKRFAHVTSGNAGETLFVRCERQTLRRLPDTGAVLFTIGIAVQPLGRLSDGLVARIAANVSRLAGGEHERRAAPHYAAPLAAYAATRAAGLENAA
jgi:hypothetical protein